ncbi:HNH endonuclease signature motif containing protein [Bacillus altitudinis]
MKKLAYSIFFMVFLLTAWLWTSDAEASQSKDGITTYKETHVLEVDENGHAKEIQSKSDIIDQARQQFKNQPHDPPQRNMPQGDTVVLQPSTKNKNTNKTPDANTKVANTIVIDTLFKLDQSKKAITHSSTIRSIIGKAKPIIVIVGSTLFVGDDYAGKYNAISTYTKEFTGSQIKVGATKSKTYKMVKTKFVYKSDILTAGWVGSAPGTKQSTTETYLVNKNAYQYPQIHNSHSGKSLPAPTKANMKWYKPEDRVKRDKDIRNKYIRWYIGKYGDPKWDWSGLDIHHVIPLEYGGDNKMGNLYALTRTLHQQEVSPWWRGYR